LSNQNSRPVGLAIRELRDNLFKAIKDSGLNLSVVVLVLKDVTQQVAEAEVNHIQQYLQQQNNESNEESKGE